MAGRTGAQRIARGSGGCHDSGGEEVLGKDEPCASPHWVHTIPQSIKQFVKQQTTQPVQKLVPESETEDVGIPYTAYWQRAVAAMLLSGRVKAKNDGYPNRTDVYRLCKEANFHPYLFEQTGRFFVAGKILKSDRRHSTYEPRESAEAFWNRDLAGLQQASRRAFVTFVGELTGHQISRPCSAHDAYLDVFLIFFAKAFQGLAVEEKSFGQALADFSRLPDKDLARLGKELGSP